MLSDSTFHKKNAQKMIFFAKIFGQFKNLPYLCTRFRKRSGGLEEIEDVFNAMIAQLVEHDLAKVGVASSSLVHRSEKGRLVLLSFSKNKFR